MSAADEVDLARAATAPFSPADGHRDLAALAGRWHGTTRTWLDPSAPPEETATTARAEVILGGRFVRLEYRGTVMGTAHAGEMLLGYEPNKQLFTAVWVDSFHSSPAIMVSTGERGTGGAVSVLGSYEGGCEHWGWRTVLRASGSDEVVIEAFNIAPDGTEYPAIATTLGRSREDGGAAGP
jgi:Protein of unknown function (DUF1579)